jgi:hypothetical protein
VARQRRQLAVAHLVAHEATRQGSRAQDPVLRTRVVQAPERRVQEPGIESGVVRDDHATVHELQQRGRHRLDGWMATNHRLGDTRQRRDRGGYRLAGVHERCQLTDSLTVSHLDGRHFGDAAVAGGTPRGLQIEHDKRRVVQRHAQLVQALPGRR